MVNDNTPPDTLRSVLASIGVALKARNGADKELADILATHLLVADPTNGVVEDAHLAILKLAAARADLPEVAS